jgi:hypothetical protein
MLENVQVIQEKGQNKFAVIDFEEFVLVKELLSNAEKLEDYLDYLHIQTVKKQDKLPRHSFDDVMAALKVNVNAGLANAIIEGRENDFVSEDEIFASQRSL